MERYKPGDVVMMDSKPGCFIHQPVKVVLQPKKTHPRGVVELTEDVVIKKGTRFEVHAIDLYRRAV